MLSAGSFSETYNILHVDGYCQGAQFVHEVRKSAKGLDAP